jgi:hypothetical protein
VLSGARQPPPLQIQWMGHPARAGVSFSLPEYAIFVSITRLNRSRTTRHGGAFTARSASVCPYPDDATT